MLLLKWTLRALWAFTAKQLHAAIVDRPTVKALPAAKPFPGMVKPVGLAQPPIPVYPVSPAMNPLPALTMLDLEAIRVGEMTAQAMVTPAIAVPPTPPIAEVESPPIVPATNDPVEPAIEAAPPEPSPEPTEPSPFDFPLEDEPPPPLDRATLVEALLDEAWNRGIRTYPQLIQYVELQTGKGCSRRTISRWKTARQLITEAA